jgi:alpha/beta superfamily hydrolase
MAAPTTLRIPVRDGLTLEGRLWKHGDAGAIIAPPHPVYGGSIGNPVVRALETRMGALGLSTLAFNWRGVGDSDGTPSEDRDEALEDYLAAAQALDMPLQWVAGYSFGAIAALGAAVKLDVPAALLVAPAMPLFDDATLAAYSGELRVIAGAHDEVVPAEWLKRTFGTREKTRLEMLHGLNHYFLGSAVQRLAEGLERLTA